MCCTLRFSSVLIIFSIIPATLNAGVCEYFLKSATSVYYAVRHRFNKYHVNRDLKDYCTDALGNTISKLFLKDLAALKKNDVWIDLGAGEARAIRQYHKEDLSWITEWSFGTDKTQWPVFSTEKGKSIAIMHVQPKNIDLKKIQQELGGSDYFDYRLGDILKVNPGSLPMASIITDMMGPHAYVKDLSKYFEIVFSNLKVGGKFYTHHSSNTSFVLNGEQIYFTEFFKMIKGIKFDNHHSMHGIEIIKVEENVVIPKLKLKKLLPDFKGEVSGPPVREYEVIQ